MSARDRVNIGPEFRRQRVERPLVAPTDDDTGARAGKDLRDAAAGAGDESGTAGECHGRISSAPIGIVGEFGPSRPGAL